MTEPSSSPSKRSKTSRFTGLLKKHKNLSLDTTITRSPDSQGTARLFSRIDAQTSSEKGNEINFNDPELACIPGAETDPSQIERLHSDYTSGLEFEVETLRERVKLLRAQKRKDDETIQSLQSDLSEAASTIEELLKYNISRSTQHTVDTDTK
ncbi:uncharacterized protein L201_001477 [Kwoniella dendrophila CBS 6074]|uniref:Uncharacterized protein n=1 Tax=Kwoniella dendrophila CBS 6074 TaxID=1295534 RepID=A0AAX4JPY2_9TREE